MTSSCWKSLPHNMIAFNNGMIVPFHHSSLVVRYPPRWVGLKVEAYQRTNAATLIKTLCQLQLRTIVVM